MAAEQWDKKSPLYGRLVKLSTKPRLVRNGRGWACIGLVKQRGWWNRMPETLVRHEVTPEHAWRQWMREADMVRIGA